MKRMTWLRCMGCFGVAGISTVALLAMPRDAGAQTRFDLLHTFSNASTDGATPGAQLMRAGNGIFYGTTVRGGAFGLGTVFRVAPTGNFAILHSFAGGASDGDTPYAPLLQASDGNLYGTTTGGGAAGRGTVYSVSPSGAFTLLHSFLGAPTEGSAPWASLIQGTDGMLYGTTYSGGSVGYGTIYRIATDGTGFQTMWSLRGATAGEGANIYAGLVQASDGNLYGAAYAGGIPAGYGSIFRITPSGTMTTLYLFTGGTAGRNPIAPLIQASDGNLYGTTHLGGSGNVGVAFKMPLGGTPTPIHQFVGTDGGWPDARLVQGPDRNFYGTTTIGGTSYAPGFTAFGTAFKMTPSGDVTVLHSFTSGSDGANPSSLYRAIDGNFYGTTASGGSSVRGVVFRLRQSTVNGDFDWDTATDMTVFRPSSGTWYSLQSGSKYTTYSAVTWGVSTDMIAPADYDGDGRVDVAVFRPSTGTWYSLDSSTGNATYTARTWGMNGDIPVPADYDGDGKADYAVYRPSSGLWCILLSGSGYRDTIVKAWGLSSDVPVVGDFDGDGKADIGVYRPSTATWYILTSSSGYSTTIAQPWGVATDIPVVGDYDGDGKSDMAVYRPSTGFWYILLSSNRDTVAKQWGVSSDMLVPGDYDGDGKTDIGVYRPSTGYWYVLKSSSNNTDVIAQQWGLSSDVPVNKK